MSLRDIMEEHLEYCNSGEQILQVVLSLAEQMVIAGESMVIFENGTCLLLEADAEIGEPRSVESLKNYAIQKFEGMEAEQILNLVQMDKFEALYFPVDMEQQRIQVALEDLDEWERNNALELLPKAKDRVQFLQPEWDWRNDEVIMNLVVENSFATDELQLSAAPAAFQCRSQDMEERKVVCVVHDGVKQML